jgi:hypothetical protein
MRLGEVKTVPLDVVQTRVGVHAGDWLAMAAQFHRLERCPGAILGWQVGSRRLLREAKHAADASEGMDSHFVEAEHLERVFFFVLGY